MFAADFDSGDSGDLQLLRGDLLTKRKTMQGYRQPPYLMQQAAPRGLVQQAAVQSVNPQGAARSPWADRYTEQEQQIADRSVQQLLMQASPSRATGPNMKPLAERYGRDYDKFA